MRARILDLARAMIVEEGPGAISARSLAKRAKLLPGSLYNLYPSIEEIRLAALGDVLRRLADALEEVPQGLPPAERMHAYARAYLDYVERNANAWNALLEYRRNATRPAPEWYQAHIERLTRLIARCFAEHGPHRANEDAQTQARLLWAGIYGLSALSAEGRLGTLMSADIDGLVPALVETHLSAFKQ